MKFLSDLLIKAGLIVEGNATVNGFLNIGSGSNGVIKNPSTDGSLVFSGSTFNNASLPARTIIISSVGAYSGLTGASNLFVGRNAGAAVTSGTSNVFIGKSAGAGVTTGGSNVILSSSDATNLPAAMSYALHLVGGNGYRNNDASSVPASAHAFIGGGYNTGFAIKDFYFGQMPFTADAGTGFVNIAFYAPSGLGTDIGGASFTISAGRGTGGGTPGDLIFRTSTAGASGTTTQTLTDRFRIAGGSGNLTVASLAGSGDRIVVANSSGVLAATLTNPITGTGVSGQVAYWNGTNTQTGSNNLFWDNTNGRLGIGTNAPAYKLDVNGTFGATGAATFSSSVTAASLVSTGDATINGVRVGKGPNSLSGNTVLGASALNGVTTGTNNVAIGPNALDGTTTGNYNIAIGVIAGGIGANENTTGSSNIFIGTESQGQSATESNRTWIGSNTTTSTWLGGNLLLGTISNSTHRLDVVGTTRLSSTLLVGGITTLTNLAGTGTRIVVADASGILSTQATSTYLTSLSGEATNSGSVVTLTNSAVIGKVLTGLNVYSAAIASTDSILAAFGKIQGQIDGLQGGTIYKGSWNANTNTPTITSGTGTQGNYYVVTTAGTTTIDGVSSWVVGDWIIFNGTVWEKIPNVNAISSVNGQTGVVSLTTANITEVTNLYYTDARARAAISLTTSGDSGASTYSSGVLNIPTYTLAGLGGAAAATTITINGTAQDISTNRTFNVGTVTSIVAGTYLTGGTITTSGTIAVDATTANTASKIVARDASGDFSAGTITAALNGNSITATTWQTARTLTIGSTGKSLNGGADVSWTLGEIGAQAALNGTGFVKITGTTISYDNSTYLTTSSASSTYLPLAGGTLTGALIGTSATFSSSLITNAIAAIQFRNSNSLRWELDRDGTETGSNAGSNLSLYRYDDAGNFLATTLILNRATGAATFSSSLTTGGNFLIGATASTTGAMNFIRTGTTPVASRLTFGTDGTGYGFAIGKNQGGTVTDLFTILDSGEATFSSNVTAASFIASNISNNPVFQGTGNDPLSAQVRIINSSGNSYSLISGITSITNTGFTIRNNTNSTDILTFLNTGAATFSSSVTAGTNSSVVGSVILRGYYTSGTLATYGTDASSGAPMLSYGVESAQTSTQGAFVSSTGISTLERGAYVLSGNHIWYTAAAQTISLGSAVTMTKRLELYNSGNLVLGGGADDGVNRLQVSGAAKFSSSVTAASLVVSGTTTSSYIGQILQTNTTAGVSFGLLVKGGTNSSDVALNVQSAASGNLFRVFGDGQAIFSSSVTTASLGVNVSTIRTRSEIAAILAAPTPLNTNVSAGNLLLSDGGNIGLVMGLYDTSFDSYIQARNNSALNNTAYNLLLNPLGGNVGIGITTPTAKLDVFGAGKFSSSITAGSFIPSLSTIPTNGLYLGAANQINISTNSTSRFSITSTGESIFTGAVTASNITIDKLYLSGTSPQIILNNQDYLEIFDSNGTTGSVRIFPEGTAMRINNAIKTAPPAVGNASAIKFGQVETGSYQLTGSCLRVNIDGTEYLLGIVNPI